MSPKPATHLPVESAASHIRVVRDQKVLLDTDLAELYGVPTKVLVQSVKRNIDRFSGDFMFQLDAGEWESLRSQSVTSNTGRGGRRYPPFAFTEQGVAMLSSVLGSAQAIAVNIEIMRAFVRLREDLETNRNESRAGPVGRCHRSSVRTDQCGPGLARFPPLPGHPRR